MLPACVGPVALRRFRKDEDGTLIVFALVLFLLMVMIGGIAVDVMRYEQKRTALQNTLDRATLAAASLDQKLDAETVARDYVTKAGMADQLEDVSVVAELNGKMVRATGRVDTNPFFMHLIGINEFDATAASAAEQRITNVEIVLVLDVSGSMSGAKIASLRDSASEFVDSVLSADPERRISIAVVPYNAQVNLGSVLRAEYNATDLHGVANANCLELPSSVFGAPGLSTATALPMSAIADVSNSTNRTNGYVAWSNTSYSTMVSTAPFCRTETRNIVRLPSSDIATLQSQINALQAGGNTSITLGMKWGLALLDPSARPMFSGLIDDGRISSEFAGRPFDYSDNEAMKVVVLMTDGEHVSHNRINDGYKTGASPIWRSAGDGNYSIRFTTGRPASAGTNQYWVPHRNEWRATPWNSGAGVTQQQWQQVWAAQRLTWVAWQLYARALGTTDSSRNTAYTNAMAQLSSTYASVADMNSSLQASCAQAKDNGVVVYGIAFEAPENGQHQISQCASSEEYYFDAANPAEMQSAFRAIASSISQLRLTQ
ncbi:MAG: TadE/TadG family protein [Rhodobacteraceae bacterium]|nr:TadE/TadG family protein [Paracoccaceae bacterium]